MRVRWTPDAASDLEGIHAYLSVEHPELVQSTVLFVYREIKALARFPMMGREAVRPGFRELYLAPLPYLCTYRVEEDAVVILRIHHTAQNRVV